MTMITGVLERINSRDGVGARNSTVYSVQLGGQWYSGWWDNPPRANEGDMVEFDATQNGQYWNANPKTFRVVTAANAAASVATTGAPAPAVRVDSRQNSIVYQSSRKDAIALVGTLLEHDCLSLGSKKADRAGIVLDFVEELTDDFAWAAINPEIASPEDRLQQNVINEVQQALDED